MTNPNVRFLSVPDENSVRYKSNFIKTAVCELRFPILLELEESQPHKFQAALRKDYPFFSKEHEVSVRGDGTPSTNRRYLFESKKKDWTVVLKPSSIAIETTRYLDFQDFSARVSSLLDRVGQLLDTDFFTRVGLRYINAIPLQDETLSGWINPVLVAPVEDGSLGALTKFHSEIRGFVKDGEYALRHGFDPNSIADGIPRVYVLDFDYYSEGVDFDRVLKLITDYNAQNFSFFRWTIGEKAKEALGDGVAKK